MTTVKIIPIVLAAIAITAAIAVPLSLHFAQAPAPESYRPDTGGSHSLGAILAPVATQLRATGITWFLVKSDISEFESLYRFNIVAFSENGPATKEAYEQFLTLFATTLWNHYRLEDTGSDRNRLWVGAWETLPSHTDGKSVTAFIFLRRGRPPDFSYIGNIHEAAQLRPNIPPNIGATSKDYETATQLMQVGLSAEQAGNVVVAGIARGIGGARAADMIITVSHASNLTPGQIADYVPSTAQYSRMEEGLAAVVTFSLSGIR